MEAFFLLADGVVQPNTPNQFVRAKTAERKDDAENDELTSTQPFWSPNANMELSNCKDKTVFEHSQRKFFRV